MCLGRLLGVYLCIGLCLVRAKPFASPHLRLRWRQAAHSGASQQGVAPAHYYHLKRHCHHHYDYYEYGYLQLLLLVQRW